VIDYGLISALLAATETVAVVVYLKLHFPSFMDGDVFATIGSVLGGGALLSGVAGLIDRRSSRTWALAGIVAAILASLLMPTFARA
jgi:hypothetical protein